MHVLCAPDSFKETLTAIEAAEAIAAGVRDADPCAANDVCPIADGGEGSLAVLVAALGGRIESSTVLGPLGGAAEPLHAKFGLVESRRLGIVELAEASGLGRIASHQRDPMRTTTFGTGELIRAAIDHGCEEILVCIGGSATVDGGAGLAQALGTRFFDEHDREFTQPITGGDLRRIARIQSPSVPATIRVACDVRNPLTGPRGAARVYGPQKGASPDQVERLDTDLARLATLTDADPTAPGAGASGGAGFGLLAFCGARLESGTDLILEVIDFDARCTASDLVITGEGRLDDQSLHGKACLGAAGIARRHGVPCIAIVGQAGDGAESCLDAERGGYLTRVVSLTERFGIDRAMREPDLCLRRVATEVVREFRARA